MAGYSCGIKNAVGWLRDDSRGELHQQGNVFFEKIAEINHFPSIRKKLRLIVTLVDSALLDIGPDEGGRYAFDQYAGLASTSLIGHDALASALLPWLDKQTLSLYDIYSPYPGHANYWNRSVIKDFWGKRP